MSANRLNRFLATLAFAGIALFAPAANAIWPQSLGSLGKDQVVAVRTSPSGDLYVAGHFSGSMDLGGTTLIAQGLQDVFVVRVGAGGNVIWARSAGGASLDTVRDIALDTANNLYVVGNYFQTASFGGSTIGNAPNFDGYIAKINTSGAWQWARTIGGGRNDVALGVVTAPGDASQIPPVPESAIVVGHYECTAAFGGSTTVSLNNNRCAVGNHDLFVARVSSSGEWLWARDRGAAASGYDVATHVAIDRDNRVYVVGTSPSGGNLIALQDDFASSPLSSANWTSDNNHAITSPSFGVTNPMLGQRGFSGSVTSRAINTQASPAVIVSADIYRGEDQFNFPFYDDHISEYADSGDDYHVEFLNAAGNWQTLEDFFGGGAGGQRYIRSGATAYTLNSADARHPNFRLRFRFSGGAGGNYDWWHVDNVRVETVAPDAPFLFAVSNVISANPTLGGPTGLPAAFGIHSIAMDLSAPAAPRLLMHGSRSGDVTMTCGALTGVGTMLLSLEVGAAAPTCRVIKGSNAGATGTGVAVDNSGRIYLTGAFSGTDTRFYGVAPNPEGTLDANPSGNDVFIASMERDGSWRWVTGGKVDAVGPSGIPARAGGGGDDRGLAIATDGVGTVYVGGQFQSVASVGIYDTLTAIGEDDGFLLNLGTDGRFFQEEAWTAGVPLVPPPNAKVDDLAFVPEFYRGGVRFDAIGAKLFSWTRVNAPGQNAQLVGLQPSGSVEVRWRVVGTQLESTARITSLGKVVWPDEPCADNQQEDCFQVHVVGAPVSAEPAAGDYKILELINPDSGSAAATVNSGLFNAQRAGTSVIVYINGPTLDPNTYPTRVEIVRSLPYGSVPLFVDNVPAEIGQRIVDAHHNEPNRTGFVVNELAYYDGAGSDAAYSRSSRSGAIVPVNRYSSARPQEQGRDLVVAWYHLKAKGVYWAEKAVRYLPHWPFDPDRIIVASQQGGEVLGQQPLDPLQFPSAKLYIQNDIAQAGFNPNDEHALMSPSTTGTGFDAVFALRSDFGSGIVGDEAASSDPYVLIKYFHAASALWKFRVYRVLATGAGFDSFRFPGVAGTTVSPPYPVRTLPGCAKTYVLGQAVGEQPPPPFFQDYKNQLWAKSAGSGSVHYYYPAQAGFFVDLDLDDENDIATGTCVPWLARLPADQGGTASPLDPIKVDYDISWPESVPQLVSGETLLTPKRGLPDILNQAAVEVVYDDIQDTVPDALPSDTLAQLLDPLNPRFVRLNAVPSAIATEFQTDGTDAILSSADGVIKLPASVRQRIRFEPINKRLVLKGVLDESGVGEPFLLLNVLSKRDRVALKKLNGGDGNEESGFTGTCAALGCTWDQAVEALFRKSRNPQGITGICTQSHLDEQRQRVCDQSRAVTADDVLIGYQDENGDRVLEPYQAVGVNAALSAGLSQGSGYMTIAFNNDAALNPLPVSLEVIKVGCLTSPPPPATPTLVKSYQGQINVIQPDNIFDEQVVLRHSGDFGGNPDALEFEWFYHPDTGDGPPTPLPDPATGQLNGWIQFPAANPQGQVEISIEGANIQTLSDNWYLVRYRGLPTCNNASQWSLWAGQPGGTPANQAAQLAEGWVKRVLDRLNPYEARVQDFGQAATNNYASMLIQLGERYEGPIALNNDPNNLNNVGLIEAYSTVMRRAMQLSVGSTPPVDYGPANAAILLVASRLVEFYTLLGNEAYADAQDPTIGITTGDGSFSLAPSIFNFQNQVDSLLSEELVLLRGRDSSAGPIAARPVYNRFFWNFTTGDGEVAYALSYNVSDQNRSGVIDETDARIMFPQGHGDAWGHYLTAATTYYELLRHPFFSWNPQTESVSVAGAPIQVDFMDERQFAETAAAKARTGAEIVDLTYRSAYVDDPNGQWQGYEDTNNQRGWGLSEWGRRGGMGAYFDWVTANAIIPDEDPDPQHVGIKRIDRRTVTEIDEIASQYASIQGQVDKADAGLNPLGLARGVVPFDIDPSQLVNLNKTQFEQVYERAMASLNNVLRVWDFANQLTNQMRRNQDSVDQLNKAANAQENDYSNQLIEIFGYPYADDIGPGGVYPAGYDGPDLYHYQLMDVPTLAGSAFDLDGGVDGELQTPAKISHVTGVYAPMPNGANLFGVSVQPQGAQDTNSDGQPCADNPLSDGCALGNVNFNADSLQLATVPYEIIESPDYGLWFTKPEGWSGQRRAPGRLQQILQQMLQARVAVKQAMIDYDKLRLDIEDAIGDLQAFYQVSNANLNILRGQRNELKSLTTAAATMSGAAIAARRAGEFMDATFKGAVDCIPKSFIAGLAAGGDIASGARCAVTQAANVPKFVLDTVADGLEIAQNSVDAAKEDVTELAGINTAINDQSLDFNDAAGEIDALIRAEPALRAEIFARVEAMKQLQGDYYATLAEGQRVLERKIAFRRAGAAEVQEYRYQDMAFRIFRNDALQKYRAAFDLAARYAYLAASAYDYETNLLGSDSQAGQAFLTNIVRQRSIGQVLNGNPVPGTPGIADTMAQLKLNFDVLKGQMGFNNPQVETNRFSLRRELFRIPDGPEGDAAWRAKLDSFKVADLWAVPEFRRLARPFAPESAGPQPGLVIEFDTNVTFGLNFFGWELGPQDSSYDSSKFATRVRSVGTWFGNYDTLPLADDPRIYLFPAGADVLRSPSADDFRTREWQIVDQAIPIPFPIGAQDLDDYNWNPVADTLNGASTDVRRYGRFRAYHLSEPFDDSQVTADSRLIGRSVWNTKWVMIIPGGTFLADSENGLETFIHGTPIPGGNGERDGNGVDDIRVFFETYAYTGL
ncbi:MAG TPA: hypothetical protein PLB00_02205 [Pseudomonadota bacterium]|nr:hypothetical protein [Pseudomonadota bacterium]